MQMHELSEPQPARWFVAQVFSKRAGRLVFEAQEMKCGVFLPTYAKVRYVDGQRSSTLRQLLPGYLFVKLRESDRAAITELEGVYRILPGGERVLARLDAELPLFELKARMGEFNEFDVPPVAPARKRRRPRRSRRLMKIVRGIAA